MALQYAEGFDGANTIADLINSARMLNLGNVTVGNATTASGTRFGRGRCVTLTASFQVTAGFPITGTFSSGIYYGISAQANGSTGLYLGFYDTSTSTMQCMCAINGSTGIVTVYRGNLATLLGTSSTGVPGPTGWHRYELTATISATVGTFELRVDGNTIISLTGLNNKGSTGANMTACIVGAGTSSGSTQGPVIDDVTIADNTGSRNNTWLSDLTVETIVMTGDDAVQWTKSTGATNFSNIDDVPENGDTDYNLTNTAAQQDTFTHGNLSGTPDHIVAVQVQYMARKDDAAAHTMKSVLISGATTAFGATISPGSSYGYFTDIWEVDPNTSAAWTASAVNATKPGYNLVS